LDLKFLFVVGWVRTKRNVMSSVPWKNEKKKKVDLQVAKTNHTSKH